MEISDAVEPMMTMLLGSNIFERFLVGIVIGSQRFTTLNYAIYGRLLATSSHHGRL